jgi:RNA polymerase sigma factor (sigma-70 family)
MQRQRDSDDNATGNAYFFARVKSFALLTEEQEVQYARQMHDNNYERILITTATVRPAEDYLEQLAQKKGSFQETLARYRTIGTIDEKVAFLRETYNKYHLTEEYCTVIGAYYCLDAQKNYPAPMWSPVWPKLKKKRQKIKESERKKRIIPATPYVIEFSDACRKELDANQELSDALGKAYRRVAGSCLSAYHAMINANLRLVGSIAFKYRSAKGTTVEDMIEVGSVGLCQAAQKFDYKRKIRFSTYATHWIRQTIERHIKQESTDKAYRIPSYQLEIVEKAKKVRRELEAKQERSVSNEEVARETVKRYGIKERKVILLLEADAHAKLHSFESPIGTAELMSYGDIVTYEHGENPFGNFDPRQVYLPHERRLLLADIQERIDEVIARALTPKQEFVIRMRNGMYAPRSYGLEEIGNMLHLTRERIRQIEIKAKRRLKREVEFYGLLREYGRLKAGK